MKTQEQIKANKKINTVFLPRLLSERKAALVLLRDQQGVWVTRNGPKLSVVLRRGDLKRTEMIEVMTNISSLLRIEIPYSLNFQEATNIVKEISRALKSKHPLIEKVKKEGRIWNLAFRRIQGMGFNGCFDAATQTIVVDPRHIESLKHEFCHWLLGHDVIKRENLKFFEQDVHRIEHELFNIE